MAPRDSDSVDGRAPKRRKTTGRRRAACQTCSLRKVKCDNSRPKCSSCQQTKTKCVYLDEADPGLTLEKAVEILGSQISVLKDKVEALNGSPIEHRDSYDLFSAYGTNDHYNDRRRHTGSIGTASHVAEAVDDARQSSRDFAHIPAHKTTADQVLLWPIFEEAFPPNYLIDPHLGYRLSSGGNFDEDPSLDEQIFALPPGSAPLDDLRIPSLVDCFLENVHTKNPILDVEALVRKSRAAATDGLGSNGFSCLLLITCACGLIAKPFGSEREAIYSRYSVEEARQMAAPTKDRATADSCFLQAIRKLSGLRPSILAAQCNFFAGVYLMYTLRPMISWQYFYQASINYQLYLKTNGRITDDQSILMERPLESRTRSSKTGRLEQRLYWSCFKSEAEFRVELPLPQSEIADYDFPHLFPSPPSPLPTEVVGSPIHMHHSGSGHSSPLSVVSLSHVQIPTAEDYEIKLHAKRLCNEEESWYYYLTEVALRRIGNRIINTFFSLDCSQWMEIGKLLKVAAEFESQVSTWKTNLPSVMQKYESSETIKAPSGHEAGFVSQELSWATENRLLEMRHWLYQPFLYYLIHARPSYPSPTLHRQDSSGSNPELTAGLAPHQQSAFWALIARAIDCNLTILDSRSIPHRHHGLWFDLRAIICSTLLFIAIVKSGYEGLIPGGIPSLIRDPPELLRHSSSSSNEGGAGGIGGNGSGNGNGGGNGSNASGSGNGSIHHPHQRPRRPSGPRIEGRFGRVLRQLDLWSPEAPDLVRSRDLLEMLIHQVIMPKVM